MIEIFEKVDRSFFFYFQELRNSWWDYVLTWPTVLGDALFALSLMIAGIFAFDKTVHKNQRVLISVTAILTTYWITHALKLLFNRPRPFLLWENVEVVFAKPISAAFPSGHAAIIFAVALLLNYFYPKKMIWAYALAIWVSLTRVYIGVHYPSDILAGCILGIACTFFVCRRWKASYQND